jgi:hypothetical protein
MRRVPTEQIGEGNLTNGERLPWWRQAKVTRWDYGIGLALVLLVMTAQTIWFGTGWPDSWIAAGCWFVVVVVLIGVRSRLIRES